MLQKALQIGLTPIVVVNKVDKPNCRPDVVHEAVFDLMYNLDATEHQLNFHTVYGSAKNNWMSEDWKDQTDSIVPLLDAIIKYIPEPESLEGTPQMLITSLDYSSYVGRIAVGRIHPEPLKPIAIDEPTMSMVFTINNSPFFGKDGKFVTSRHIHDRLIKELDKNLALRVEKNIDSDIWRVYGRGVLHLSVLIETMRREGYELQVGQPQVIFKEIDGKRCEPIEQLTINLPEAASGKIIEMVAMRKGEMLSMDVMNDRIQLEFLIPSRGIIGLRNSVLTASAGEAIMSHRFLEYQPYKGEIERRNNGSIIAMESGTAFAYAIDKLQDRGRFFIFPQDEIYSGQVVGESAKDGDMVVNVTKSKKLTNMRASGSDDKTKLIPPVVFSLEEALEYIKEDEYVEITPHSIRLRKIYLDENDRKRNSKK